jgi:hypothetical protein
MSELGARRAGMSSPPYDLTRCGEGRNRRGGYRRDSRFSGRVAPDCPRRSRRAGRESRGGESHDRRACRAGAWHDRPDRGFRRTPMAARPRCSYRGRRWRRISCRKRPMGYSLPPFRPPRRSPSSRSEANCGRTIAMRRPHRGPDLASGVSRRAPHSASKPGSEVATARRRGDDAAEWPRHRRSGSK